MDNAKLQLYSIVHSIPIRWESSGGRAPKEKFFVPIAKFKAGNDPLFIMLGINSKRRDYFPPDIEIPLNFLQRGLRMSYISLWRQNILPPMAVRDVFDISHIAPLVSSVNKAADTLHSHLKGYNPHEVQNNPYNGLNLYVLSGRAMVNFKPSTIGEEMKFVNLILSSIEKYRGYDRDNE